MTNEWSSENPYPNKREFVAQREAFEEAIDATHKAIVEWLSKFYNYSPEDIVIGWSSEAPIIFRMTLKDWQEFKEEQ